MMRTRVPVVIKAQPLSKRRPASASAPGVGLDSRANPAWTQSNSPAGGRATSAPPHCCRIGVGILIATPTKGQRMPDKSPQRPAGKKAGKTLKEKREAKKDKQDHKRSLPA